MVATTSATHQCTSISEQVSPIFELEARDIFVLSEEEKDGLLKMDIEMVK